MIRGKRRAGVGVGVLAVALLALLPAAAHAVPKTFFGVVPQAPLDTADFERMGDANVGLLRFEIFWAGIDPTASPDDYDWSSTDALIGNAASQGIRVLPVVASVPNWVVAFDGRNCAPGTCPPFAPEGKQALAAWKAFLADAVERYGPNGTFWSLNPTIPRLPVGAWQIWNEQNSPSFFKPRPNVRIYAKLLGAAHDAIVARDPGAKIILGGMFGTPRGGQKPAIAAWDYLAKLYRRKGAKKDFDAVAPHPYAPRLSKVKAQIELLRDEIKRAGDKPELWITEIGWASGGPPNPLNRGLGGQAKRLRQAFEYFLDNRKRLRLKTVDWYSWRDNAATDIGLCDWCPKSGLLNEDRSAKPAFDAFASLTGGS